MVFRPPGSLRLWSSLRTEIVVKVIVMTVAMVLLVSLVAFRILELEVLRQRLRGAERVIAAVDREIARPEPRFPGAAPDLRAEDLQRILSLFVRAGNLRALYLVDREGRIRAHADPAKIDTRDTDPVVARARRTGKAATSFGGGRLAPAGLPLALAVEHDVRIALPLASRGADRLVGVAVVPLSDVKNSIARSGRVLLAFILLDSFLLVVFGSWFLSRAMVRPLESLARGAEAIAAGDLAHRVPAGRDNEIGDLARAFNAMAERLRGNRDRIREQVAALEHANSELARTQADLIRSEKLASVGRLAAGVAHEIGNPLSSILGLTDILQRGAVLEAGAGEPVAQIQKETLRIHGILRRLLDFSRPAKAELREVDVNATVRETLALAAPMADLRPVETVLDLDGDLPRVRTDPALLQQVLLNLVMNAAHAMPDGGTLRIATRSALFEGPQRVPPRRARDPENADFEAIRRAAAEGPRAGDAGVEIGVADTGCGIPPEILPYIFDPFFTTKEPGRGTGLGLAVAHGILELLKGRISARSDVGKGTAVTVWLPAQAEDR